MNDRDQKWIEQAQQGDISAFRHIVELHQQKIYRLAYDLMGNHHTAEDLSQEAFIKAHHALKDFRGQASISSWLYRIILNLFIDRNRSKSSNILEFRQDIETEHTANSDDPSPQMRSTALLVKGISQLIKIAQTHPHLEIRKRAIQLLGSSKDPRAHQALLDLATPK